MNAAVLQPVQETLVQKIQVKNLNFYYGAFHALKDINLEIPERKVTAFIGPRAAASLRCCAPSTACMRSIQAGSER